MVLLYLKMVSELSLYFSFIVGMEEIFKNTINVIPVILVLSLSPCLSEYLYNKFGDWTRLLGIAPAIIIFFLSYPSFLNIIILIPPAVYAILISLKKGIELDYYAYKTQFNIWAVISALIYFLWFALHVFMRYDMKNFGRAFIYFAVFFVIGAFVARRLRFKDEKLVRPSARGLITVGGIVVIGLGISKLIEQFWQKIFTALMYVFAPLFIPLGALNDWWIEYAGDVGKMHRTTNGTEMMIRAIEEEASEIIQESVSSNVIRQIIKRPHRSMHFNEFLVLFTLLFLTCAFSFAAYLLSKRKLGERKVGIVREKLEDMPAKRKVDHFSNEEKVRKIYRQFLSKAWRSGVIIRPTMTSEEILDVLKGVVNDEEARALRNIYICARYNDFSKTTDEDVRLAKEALKKL